MQDGNKKRFKFTSDEDILLTSLVTKFGEDNWALISRHMINRSIRQCRERWRNYLSPNVRTDPFSPEEDAVLVEKVRVFGNRWRFISKFFYGRSDIAVKNRWQHLRHKKEQADFKKAICSQVKLIHFDHNYSQQTINHQNNVHHNVYHQNDNQQNTHCGPQKLSPVFNVNLSKKGNHQYLQHHLNSHNINDTENITQTKNNNLTVHHHQLSEQEGQISVNRTCSFQNDEDQVFDDWVNKISSESWDFIMTHQF
ncbi:Myb-like DNA-binding domain containing protein [Tritrichomonas foetus]|uniref:Myb-like DNA-binding domain containing protein n=1 Tax=Tritrichomonas foetus TaxID=1144522 RepID=A0A1J4JS70_9EUKA|nr:Myb-like DNA-binding domain containing protein [Tritrichomonas foetus]|eukprot:OHT01280.1 Myb-like DNA-binding domain containing protein [Tritrichomonas foetus]